MKLRSPLDYGEFAARFLAPRGRVPRNRGLGGRMTEDEYRCVGRLAQRVADAALERHRASVDEHCTRHPAFCVYGAWELPSANASDEDPPPGEPTTPDECATGEQYHLREGYWSSFPR